MSQVAIFFILIYQATLSPLLATFGGCRFSVSCSEYAIHAVRDFGVVHGSYKSFVRILRCNPFSS